MSFQLAQRGYPNVIGAERQEVLNWSTKVRVTRTGSTSNIPGTASVTYKDQYVNTLYSRTGAYESDFDTGYINPTKRGQVYQVILGAVGACAGQSYTLTCYGRTALEPDKNLAQVTVNGSYAGGTFTPTYTATPLVTADLTGKYATSARWVMTVSTGYVVSPSYFIINARDGSTQLGRDDVAGSTFYSSFNRTLDFTDDIAGTWSVYLTTVGCASASGTLSLYITIGGVEYLFYTTTFTTSSGTGNSFDWSQF